MLGEHVGTVGTTLLLVGGFVAKAGAAGSVDPMMHMMRNLFTTTYTDGDACPAEDAACVASASCLACNDAYMAAFSGCAASLTSTFTCDDLAEAMCCAAEGCEDNEEFADIMGCINGDLGCGVIDIGDCAGGGSTAISGSDTTTDSTSTTETDCPTEISACNADSECVTCTQSYVDAVEGCFESATGSTCDDVEEAVCCAVDGCEDNEALNDLLACINAESTCSIDIGDCAADGSRAISGSGTTTYTDGTASDTTTETDGTASDTTTDTDGSASDTTTDTDGTASDTTTDTDGSASDTTTDTDGTASDTTTDTDGSASDTTTDTDGTASDTTTDTDGSASDTTTDTDGTASDTTTDTDGSASDTTTDTDGTASDTTTDTDGTASDTTTDTDGTASHTTTDTDGTASDTTTDTNGAAADDSDDTSDTIPFPVGGDEEDEEDSDADADAANNVFSAASAAAMGSSTAVWLIAAAAPGLWRRFQ
ncbi:unnamed protein product [Ectocarpus sp. CCAP 1310/34]|nr:unnamed protein product [Ectocarpus sp. CCAP 1310/34]